MKEKNQPNLDNFTNFKPKKIEKSVFDNINPEDDIFIELLCKTLPGLKLSKIEKQFNEIMLPGSNSLNDYIDNLAKKIKEIPEYKREKYCLETLRKEFETGIDIRLLDDKEFKERLKK